MIIVLNEAGYGEALLGLSLSYNQPVEKMAGVAKKLVLQGGSHAKFLESMVIWFSVKAPRYWWQQFDTYRAGVTKQSGSTMHTVMQRELVQDDFVREVYPSVLNSLNRWIKSKDFDMVKANLPEGFLQERVVCLNYKVLAHMYGQRNDHRLKEWQNFFDFTLSQLIHPHFITSYGRGHIDDNTVHDTETI